ncbi:ArsC/Spx/MgsR family protein [Chryseobacterium sp. C39-AII1]|uniref:ArsC/Spx/MgsR family protein n=1 Tax=Chryseobacterium sp. C39-AII1 TaxID=3080332 RepID=UPI003208C7C3
MHIKVLHNSNCSKSNAVLEYLKENKVAFEVINIVEEPLSILEIKTVLKKLGKNISEIIRDNEKLYKEQFADKEYSEEEWLTILSENPSLVQRPILIKGNEAIIGRPIEKVIDFIEN